MPIKVSEGLLESLELGELSTQWLMQRIRTGAEHSIWQARQKRCAPALGVTPVWSMWIFNAVQLFLFFLSVSASFTSMVAIWVERRGEMRLGCSFSSHLFACVLSSGDLCCSWPIRLRGSAAGAFRSGQFAGAGVMSCVCDRLNYGHLWIILSSEG